MFWLRRKEFVGSLPKRGVRSPKLKTFTIHGNLSRSHLPLAAGADAQPGRLGNLIAFIGSRPASRCHDTISWSAQVPDAFVSAKKRSITAGTPPPAPGCDGLRKSPIA